MADDKATAPAEAPSQLENAPVTASEAAKSAEAAPESAEPPATEAKAEAATQPVEGEATSEKPAEAPTDAEPEKPAEPADTEMKDAEPAAAPAEGADKAQPEAADTTTAANETATPAKSNDKSRRKSTGASSAKKNLKKKGSMARITHLDCKPGDYYFVKAKGYTKWPGVICDEEMLPHALLKSRPVTAMRPDGTYREDVADGGKRVVDRTYPVMYLQTNEFGWVKNTDLAELDPKTVLDNTPAKMTKDLEAAYHLAAEAHPLDFFKEILRQHQESQLLELQLEEQRAQEAKERKEAKEAKAAQATPAKKSSKKAKVKTDDDLEMPDADEEEEESETTKKSNKRKADDSAETPQRAESVKKPKIKLTTSSTPKTTNGTASTPKSSKAKDESKATKSKPKKSTKESADKMEKEVTAPKEPEPTADEKHQRKEKEVLFLRHKLQRGLLTKDQSLKEEEMKTMSDYITKLEAFADLEGSIIRATKINKVLKAILKLDSIPKEEEFKFKPRSQVLLDGWNKLLAVDDKPSGDAANGVNGSSAEPSKKTPEPAAKAKTNGLKEASEDAPAAPKDSEKKEPKEATKKKEDKSEEKAEEKAATGEEAKESEPVAASA